MVESRTKINGMGLIAGNGSSYGAFIVKLKHWNERTAKGTDLTSIIQHIQMKAAPIKDARIMVMQPPAISGFGMSGGFEFSLQDRTGGDINKFFESVGRSWAPSTNVRKSCTP